MRKLIVCNIISLDGYFEGPGNDVMALPFEHAFDEYNAERLRNADVLLLGGTTYRQFRSFWPAVVNDAEARPVLREIARRNNEIDKVVVSDSLQLADTAPWEETTRVVGRDAAGPAISELKRQTGKDILVFGSRSLWNGLLTAGLVDELHLMIGPALLGGGTPLFRGPPARLKHLESRNLEGSGLVLVRYAVPARA